MKSSPEHVGIRLTDYITQGTARFPLVCRMLRVRLYYGVYKYGVLVAMSKFQRYSSTRQNITHIVTE